MQNIRKSIIALGEIIWDVLPGGAMLGGAPVNFAWHAQQLGAEVTIVSRVGNDELGRQAVGQLSDQGLVTRYIQHDEEMPTGRAEVELQASGSPRFTIVDSVAYDFLEDEPLLFPLIQSADVIYFGSLAQRSVISRATIQRYLQAAPAIAMKMFDINLRPPFYHQETITQSLEQANALKLNDEELPILKEYYGLTGDVKTQLARLADRFNLNCIAYTRGANGSLIYTEGKWSEVSSTKVNVIDTVGAGDAFTAATIMGLLHGHDLETINQHASRIAGYVCTQAGATPLLPREYLW